MKSQIVLTSLAISLSVCRAGRGEELQPDFGVSSTFSIVAVDPETGVCGAAVASKYPAVGKVVPYVRAGVGAFCTQHWHNPTWGEKALDLLEAGHGVEEILGTLLKDDDRRDKRQLAIIDMQGRAANRNPADADPSGVYWGAMSGRYYVCQGNTLTGRGVVVAMAAAYEETEGNLQRSSKTAFFYKSGRKYPPLTDKPRSMWVLSMTRPLLGQRVFVVRHPPQRRFLASL